MIDDTVSTRVTTLDACNIGSLVALWKLVDLLGASVKCSIWSLHVFPGRCLRSLARIRMEYLVHILWSVRAPSFRASSSLLFGSFTIKLLVSAWCG